MVSVIGAALRHCFRGGLHVTPSAIWLRSQGGPPHPETGAPPSRTAGAPSAGRSSSPQRLACKEMRGRAPGSAGVWPTRAAPSASGGASGVEASLQHDEGRARGSPRPRQTVNQSLRACQRSPSSEARSEARLGHHLHKSAWRGGGTGDSTSAAN